MSPSIPPRSTTCSPASIPAPSLPKTSRPAICISPMTMHLPEAFPCAPPAIAQPRLTPRPFRSEPTSISAHKGKSKPRMRRPSPLPAKTAPPQPSPTKSADWRSAARNGFSFRKKNPARPSSPTSRKRSRIFSSAASSCASKKSSVGDLLSLPQRRPHAERRQRQRNNPLYQEAKIEIIPDQLAKRNHKDQPSEASGKAHPGQHAIIRPVGAQQVQCSQQHSGKSRRLRPQQQLGTVSIGLETTRSMSQAPKR